MKDSAYWMHKVALAARDLDWAREEGYGPKIIADFKKKYDEAYQKYTNPFNIEKGTTS